MLQHPQFTLSILDPTSLLGSEVVAAVAQAFPAARRRFFHTAGVDEHLVVEVAGEAALVPPLVDTGELDGTDVVVATATPTPAVASALRRWLEANPGTFLIDGTQPGLAPDDSLPAFTTAPTARSDRRWFHLADPALWGPGTFLQALAALEPRELHLTVLLPVSSFGETGVEELAKQAAGRLSGRPPRKPEVLPAVLAFDLAPAPPPQRDALGKQLEALFPDLTHRLQAVEIGVFHGHASAAAVRCAAPVRPDRLAATLRGHPVIRLVRRNEQAQPTAVVGTDEVLCADLQCAGEWVMAWLVADGLRVGGAQAIADIIAAVRAS